jgi:hypothetical protein
VVGCAVLDDDNGLIVALNISLREIQPVVTGNRKPSWLQIW